MALEKKSKDKRRVISVTGAPKAIGPYSQGIAVGDLIFFSGQIAIDPETAELVSGGVENETKQILKNIDALLKSEDLSPENVVKTTVFITDMADFSRVNAIYGEYFSFMPPARSCVEVSKLPLGAKVEIEIIAKK